jgi:hypothetical protein
MYHKLVSKYNKIRYCNSHIINDKESSQYRSDYVDYLATSLLLPNSNAARAISCLKYVNKITLDTYRPNHACAKTKP